MYQKLDSNTPTAPLSIMGPRNYNKNEDAMINEAYQNILNMKKISIKQKNLAFKGHKENKCDYYVFEQFKIYNMVCESPFLHEKTHPLFIMDYRIPCPCACLTFGCNYSLFTH